jgi:hypothetical protein
MANKKLVDDGSKKVLSENAQEWADEIQGILFDLQVREGRHIEIKRTYKWEDVSKWDEYDD